VDYHDSFSSNANEALEDFAHGFHGRRGSITRTISCKIAGESDGINEIDDDADYKFENSNNVPKGVDKQ
jgi:hypothetical protein